MLSRWDQGTAEGPHQFEREEGLLFQVDWEGGHFSSFPLDWLKERSFREEARALYREKVWSFGTY